jgi:ankyrin repeat protein
LIIAAGKGKVEALELLLSKGANIEAADKAIIFK